MIILFHMVLYSRHTQSNVTLIMIYIYIKAWSGAFSRCLVCYFVSYCLQNGGTIIKIRKKMGHQGL